MLREAGLRPGFPELVDWARERGHRLVVFSSGFRTVIDAVLGHWGLGDLEVAEPRGALLRGGLPRWSGPTAARPARSAGAAASATTCAAASRGERLVYIGDGISDRCGARMADVVFARAHLAATSPSRRRALHPVRGLRRGAASGSTPRSTLAA